MQQSMKEKLKDNLGYLLTGVVSVFVIFAVPFIEGSVYGDIGLGFPDTTEGWIIWGIIKGLNIVANLGIFGLLQGQAKDNVKLDPSFIEANRLLRLDKNKEYNPRSLKQYNLEVWLKKGTSVLLTTAASTIVVSQLILSFSLTSFISTLIGLISTLAFGFIAMKEKEIYLTTEYLDNAKKQLEMEVKENGDKN